MKKPFGSVMHIATPLKAWVQRFALFLLLAAALSLMLLSRSESELVSQMRRGANDAVVPVLDIAGRPIEALGDFYEGILGFIYLHRENAELRERNAELVAWQRVARRLEVENESLRRLVALVPDPQLELVTARVVGDSGGAFARSVLINAGRAHGIREGQAAIAGEGLAGRVIDVGNHSARVLLATDLNSRIPVLIGAGHERSVMAGDNSDEPRLLYLPPDVRVAVGDRVVTSGHGGVFPPGLAVGLVSQVGESGYRVRLFADWSHLEYLRLAVPPAPPPDPPQIPPEVPPQGAVAAPAAVPAAAPTDGSLNPPSGLGATRP